MRLICIFCLFIYAHLCHAQSIAPFSSDGCSLFIDGTEHSRHQWSHCCIEHDFAYWQGGDQQKKVAADRQLQACVQQAADQKVAALMYLGVRMGGSPYFPTWYRWGYGWPYNRGFKALTFDEHRQVRWRLQQLQTMLSIEINSIELKLGEQDK